MIELIVLVCAMAGDIDSQDRRMTDNCVSVTVTREGNSLDGCHALLVMAREDAARKLGVDETELQIRELSCGKLPSLERDLF